MWFKTILDPNIATHQKHQALRRLEARCRDTKIKTIDMPYPARDTFLLLLAQFEYSRCCYFALGERGKPAERVADEAVDREFFPVKINIQGDDGEPGLISVTPVN